MAALQLVPRVSLRNILFTTDFSDYAERALPYAVGLARHYQSTVFVAHVIPPEPRRPMPLEAMPRELDELRYRAERAMDTFVRAAPLASVRYEVVLEKGETGAVFNDVVAKHAIDLAVIATHGRAGLRRLLMGSVAEGIFRAVPCPVLTIGPDVTHSEIADGKLRQVIYASDLSAAALHALPYAAALAAEYHAHLSCMHVIEEITNIPLYYRERALRDAREELEKLMPANSGLACEPQIIVVTGDPAEKVLQLAHELDAGLIVMGARHEKSSRLLSELPWACTRNVICHATCPVLTVRAGPQ
ncbi:MAG TPA: universal stress protein [Terriglobales bacterium]|nr:universal stress protein [Terriglobales bacterium]